MKLDYTKSVLGALDNLLVHVRKAFSKQTGFLLENLPHPSLRAKKYSEAEDLWQARVNKDWRFYFTIADNTYTIVKIIAHPK